MRDYRVFRIAASGARLTKEWSRGHRGGAERDAARLVREGAYAAGVKLDGDDGGPWLYLTCKGGPSRTRMPRAPVEGAIEGEEDWQ